MNIPLNNLSKNFLSRSYNNIPFSKKFVSNITQNTIINPLYLGKSSFENKYHINNDKIINLRKKNLRNYDINMKKKINFISNCIWNTNYLSNHKRSISYYRSRNNDFSINFTTLISGMRNYGSEMKTNKYKIYYNSNNNLFFDNNKKKERQFFGEDEEIRNFRNSFKRRIKKE